MSWRDRVVVVLLIVLAAGPVLGTLCAATCDSRPISTIVQHHSTQHCDDAADSSPVPQISGTSRHDCTGHQSGTVAATVAGRVEVGSTAQSVAAVLVERANSVIQAASTAIASSSSPPGTAPPTTIPVVLRV